MQEIIRTIDVEAAFKTRLEQLGKEIKEKKSRINDLELTGSLTCIWGGILRTAGSIAIIIGILAFIIGAGDRDGGGMILIGVVFMVSGGIVFVVGRNKVAAGKKAREGVQGEIDALTAAVTGLEVEVEKQKELYQRHMLNQQELLDREINVIDSISGPQDTKECPQCAETIKARAKICRFCGYKFE